jgi:hypothetical protein
MPSSTSAPAAKRGELLGSERCQLKEFVKIWLFREWCLSREAELDISSQFATD